MFVEFLFPKVCKFQSNVFLNTQKREEISHDPIVQFILDLIINLT